MTRGRDDVPLLPAVTTTPACRMPVSHHGLDGGARDRGVARRFRVSRISANLWRRRWPLVAGRPGLQGRGRGAGACSPRLS